VAAATTAVRAMTPAAAVVMTLRAVVI